jgi:acyl-CoA thioesterase-1
MTKTIRWLGVLICGGLAVSCGLGSSNPSAAKPTAGNAIIAFGDSLVAGRGASSGQDFVSVLSVRLGVPILNAGRSGDTTSAAMARLDRDVLAHDPRVVVVLLGGNDYLRHVPVETTFSNLGAIVDRIRERGAAVLVAGVAVGLIADPYDEKFQLLARQTSAGLVPDILGGIIGHADLMSDAIHPNDRGYALVADRLEPTLRDLLNAR